MDEHYSIAGSLKHFLQISTALINITGLPDTSINRSMLKSVNEVSTNGRQNNLI